MAISKVKRIFLSGLLTAAIAAPVLGSENTNYHSDLSTILALPQKEIASKLTDQNSPEAQVFFDLGLYLAFRYESGESFKVDEIAEEWRNAFSYGMFQFFTEGELSAFMKWMKGIPEYERFANSLYAAGGLNEARKKNGNYARVWKNLSRDMGFLLAQCYYVLGSIQQGIIVDLKERLDLEISPDDANFMNYLTSFRINSGHGAFYTIFKNVVNDNDCTNFKTVDWVNHLHNGRVERVAGHKNEDGLVSRYTKEKDFFMTKHEEEIAAFNKQHQEVPYTILPDGSEVYLEKMPDGALKAVVYMSEAAQQWDEPATQPEEEIIRNKSSFIDHLDSRYKRILLYLAGILGAYSLAYILKISKIDKTKNKETTRLLIESTKKQDKTSSSVPRALLLSAPKAEASKKRSGEGLLEKALTLRERYDEGR